MIGKPLAVGAGMTPQSYRDYEIKAGHPLAELDDATRYYGRMSW
jgi:hypothetical protein